MIDAGADVNAAAGAYAGITALQGTAIKGNISIALMLLNVGADVNAAPAMAEGRSALEGAAEHGRLDMVLLLLSAGADTEDMHFERAVEFAEKGHYAVAKFLENYSG